MKKILPLLLIISMIFSTSITINGAGDEPSSWAKEDVMDAIKSGYVPEHLQNNYQKPITREEFAELFVTIVFTEFNDAYDYYNEDTKSGWDFRTLTPENFLSKVTTTEYFTDTNNSYVKIANILGIVDGNGNHQFNPDELITREQASVMLVNYLQTVFSGDRQLADIELADINEVSPWAKNAVACSYGMGYLEGVENPVYKDDNLIKKARFDPKSYLTREQAIKILYEPAKSDRLKHIVLRGYVNVSMDQLMSGFEIDKNTVKMKKSGYDSRASLGVKFFQTYYKLRKYVDNYTAEELEVFNVRPFNLDNNAYEIENIERILSGKILTYDYDIFTATYNKPDYLIIYNKREGYDYFAGGYKLIYYPKGEKLKSKYVKCITIVEHDN